MPQMGVSVSEGTIVAWRKQPGDWVEYEEPIVHISTDKIDTEVPSPAAGRLSEIVVDVGTTVEGGAGVARLATGPRPRAAPPPAGRTPARPARGEAARGGRGTPPTPRRARPPRQPARRPPQRPARR